MAGEINTAFSWRLNHPDFPKSKSTLKKIPRIEKSQCLRLHIFLILSSMDWFFRENLTRKLGNTIDSFPLINMGLSGENVPVTTNPLISASKSPKKKPSISHGSLNVPIEHHPTMIGIWSINVYNGYFFRWCPIFPKWDIYQPLKIPRISNNRPASGSWLATRSPDSSDRWQPWSKSCGWSSSVQWKLWPSLWPRNSGHGWIKPWW